MFSLRNVSHFVGLPINLTHSDMSAQVRKAAVKILCRGLPSTISVNLRLPQFSRNHAPRLILSVHRQAWSFHQRANPACCVATAHSVWICDGRDNTWVFVWAFWADGELCDWNTMQDLPKYKILFLFSFFFFFFFCDNRPSCLST